MQVVVDGVEDVDKLHLGNEKCRERPLIECKEFKTVTTCDSEAFVQFEHNRASMQVFNSIASIFAEETRSTLCSAPNAAHPPGGGPGIGEELNIGC